MLTLYIVAVVAWAASATTAVVAMRRDRLDISGAAIVLMWAAWAVVLVVGCLL